MNKHTPHPKSHQVSVLKDQQWCKKSEPRQQEYQLLIPLIPNNQLPSLVSC